MRPKVSIIIVNYNSRDIVKCIKSIKNNKFPQDRVEIIVVDNKSSDDSLKQIRNYPGVAIVELDKNYGYGIGCNEGAHISRGEYLVFLTPDNIVSKNWLSNLVDGIDNNKSIGTVTSKVMYYGDRNKINSLGCFLTIYGICGSVNSIEHLESNTFSVFAPSGASFIIAKKTFDKIGGFDKNLFLYAEDVDIGWRVLNLGLINILAPNSITYHKSELSTVSKMPHFYFYNTRNNFLIIFKNATFPQIIPMLIFSSFFHLGRLATFILTGRISQATATFNGIWWLIPNFWQVIKIRNSTKNRNRLYIKAVTGFIQSIPIILSKISKHLS